MLYVSVRNIESTGGAVLRFNPKSGAFLGTFVSSDSTNDLQRPEGLVFGPDGNLYITSFRASTSDTDKIDIFAGPKGVQPGAFLGKIDLDQVGGDRAFAQALLFGPDGKLFVPITGGDPHTTGTVRRYDVTTKAFDIFITSAHLGQPFYLTFSQTDPATLAFVSANDAAAIAAAPAGSVPGTVNSVSAAGAAVPAPLVPTSVTLTGCNITDGSAGNSITQVGVYYMGTSGNQQLLGYGTQTGPGVWTYGFTLNLTSGGDTLLAQAEDSHGLFGDPVAITVTAS